MVFVMRYMFYMVLFLSSIHYRPRQGTVQGHRCSPHIGHVAWVQKPGQEDTQGMFLCVLESERIYIFSLFRNNLHKLPLIVFSLHVQAGQEKGCSILLQWQKVYATTFGIVARLRQPTMSSS